MTDSKPLASLSGLLLARKGNARPAMRPQVQRVAPEEIDGTEALEDLGWDDMGDEESPRQPDILPLTPAPVKPEAKAEAEADDRTAAAQLAAHAFLQDNDETDVDDDGKPAIVRQQGLLARKIGAAPAPRKTGKPAKAKAAAKANKRAAFTLRLDADRHLKLRLASTITGRSAQSLVTKALDRLIADMPEVELLAAQLKKRGKDSAN